MKNPVNYFFAGFFALIVLGSFDARAVIVDIPLDDSSASETSKASAASADRIDELIRSRIESDETLPFMSHVGMVGMGSGVYLGDGYVLTSAHVGCYPFRLTDGSSFKPNYKSWTVLNDESGRPSDLAIFRVRYASDSSLARLAKVPISSSAPSADDAMVLVGASLSQSSKPSTLRSNGKVLAVLGYRMQSKRAMTWGFNNVSEVLEETVKNGKYTTHCFLTRFDSGAREAQAAPGDSGGASFVYNSNLNRWELAGCIIGMTQTGSYIPIGTRTFLADLSAYRTQLPVEIPEDFPVSNSELENLKAGSDQSLTSPTVPEGENKFPFTSALISKQFPD